MSTTLIANGTVVTDDDTHSADVFVENEVVSLVAPDLRQRADRVIDATGKYVIPGGIDVHTHLDMPYGDTVSADDFETGTIAAAHGGTTSIIDFAVQDVGGSLEAALDIWRAKAEGKAAIDYGSRPENAGKTIVTIICDYGERNIQTILFDAFRYDGSDALD